MLGLIVSVAFTYLIVFKWFRIGRIVKTVQYGWLYVALLVFVIWLVINSIFRFFGIGGQYMAKKGMRSYSKPMYKAGPNWASRLGYLIIAVIVGVFIVVGVGILDYINNMLK